MMIVLTRQERAVMVIALMVVGSLAVLYWIMLPLSGSGNGDAVSLTGEVLYLKETASGGHLVITLDVEGRLVRVFVPEEAGASKVAEKVHVGDVLRVKGRVQVYKGREEVEVLKEEDIRVMPS
ncbi:MAG: OB-fold nucleic acid binding domain-containing protein [Methermicoccaceae archaeon]